MGQHLSQVGLRCVLVALPGCVLGWRPWKAQVTGLHTNSEGSDSDPYQPWQVIRRVEALEAEGVPPEVVVVGAGYAGVELAASLTDRFAGRARIKVVTAGAPGASCITAATCWCCRATIP